MKCKKCFLGFLPSISFLSICTFGICQEANLLATEKFSIQIQPDGTRVIQDKDGTTIEIKADGSKFIKKADGSSIEIRPDGSKLIIEKDGTSIEVLPNGTKKSEESVIKAKDDE